MIDPTAFFTYSLIALGFAFLPGPATLLTITRATSSGTKVGIATSAGIATGDLVHTFMTIVGISAIIATSASLFNIIKYLGGAYLVYLGIRAILNKTATGLTGGTLPITATKAFRQGLITEVLNPKTALFFLSFLPQFVHPEDGSIVIQLSFLGVTYVLFGLLATFIAAISAGRLGRFLRRNPAILKWQGTAVGSIYCGLGVGIVLQER
jgi:threonine/homoserine/homoserine lactone efflux protein